MSKKKVSPEEVKRGYYRKVFDSVEGRKVLADLLNELDYFNADVRTPEEVTRQNFAKLILNKLGIWESHNLKRIVDAYMGMGYLIGEEEHDKD